MKPSALCRGVSILTTVAFLWTVALTVSPRLHERIHGRQTAADHSCAVTFVRSGTVHHTAAPLGAIPIQLPTQLGRAIELTPCWVPSPFQTAAVFEHAPPHLS